MPTSFIDPWGVVVPGGDIEPATLMGRLAEHKDSEKGLIVEVDQIWPKVYMISIEVEEGYHLIDQIENFTIQEVK